MNIKKKHIIKLIKFMGELKFVYAIDKYSLRVSCSDGQTYILVPSPEDFNFIIYEVYSNKSINSIPKFMRKKIKPCPDGGRSTRLKRKYAKLIVEIYEELQKSGKLKGEE